MNKRKEYIGDFVKPKCEQCAFFGGMKDSPIGPIKIITCSKSENIIFSNNMGCPIGKFKKRGTMNEQQTLESEIKQVRDAMRTLADDNHDLRFQLKCTAQQLERAQRIIEEKREEIYALKETISDMEKKWEK